MPPARARKGFRPWVEYSTDEIAALQRSGDIAQLVAVLPVAAVESHGPHLPLGVDAMINAAILEAAADRIAPTVLAAALPAQAVGVSPEHAAFPGTLTLPPEVAIASWRAIGDSLAAAGVRRLVIFNSHGGNPPICEIVALDMRVRHAMLAAVAETWRLMTAEGRLPAAELKHGIHGGAVETALIRAIRPDLVREDAVAAFASSRRDLAKSAPRLGSGKARLAWMTQDLNPAGAVGDARLASQALGRALLDQAADGLAGVIGEVAALPLPAPTAPPTSAGAALRSRGGKAKRRAPSRST